MVGSYGWLCITRDIKYESRSSKENEPVLATLLTPKHDLIISHKSTSSFTEII